jgi:hypothetical protein
MLSFKEIFNWDWDKQGRSRKVLFSENGWYYYIRVYETDDRGYYAHGCDSSRGGDRVLQHGNKITEIRCVHCQEMAPSHFQAVVVLHEAGRRNA